ncbi:hypothetical protein ASPACDRAFT_44943 [Aspergillus aculeatus ATCC 16872]|uniref:Uncharacterized protein n=1 Tax=Aspergillus aculeatus (strain ATCC 16872 / CBS 172.66 / WB 5094) TaxID=690307 RepID=A0A1L9WQI9_ASPA1|nr:uncharacterized protein ASPACDRAFT_44943 [Aspergillus aculeatus ATCC 16872]OJJ98436.1 hypothetical protein ASPACDRAFT_44943 [Aspergillus aculeatus ATCC 16872]
MCVQIYRCHGGCWHLYRAGWLSCDKAKARPNKELCLPASGNKRDLPGLFNRIIDPDEPMFCEMCMIAMKEGHHRPWDLFARIRAAVEGAEERDDAPQEDDTREDAARMNEGGPI